MSDWFIVSALFFGMATVGVYRLGRIANALETANATANVLNIKPEVVRIVIASEKIATGVKRAVEILDLRAP